MRLGSNEDPQQRICKVVLDAPGPDRPEEGHHRSGKKILCLLYFYLQTGELYDSDKRDVAMRRQRSRRIDDPEDLPAV